MTTATPAPKLGMKAWIENKAVPPAFIGLLCALVVRASQVWSFGAFSLESLPPWAVAFINVVTGLCVALALELIMSAAGAQWFRLRNAAAFAPYDSTIPKAERAGRAATLRADARLYGAFTTLGALASVGASLWFAVSSTGHTGLGALALDLLLACVITAGVFFFGVIYEPNRPDATRATQDAIHEKITGQALQMVELIKDGKYTPEHIAFLKTVAPSLGRSMDALMPRSTEVEYWDAPRIARWLGVENDASGQRDIRRRLARALESEPALGVRRKESGRGLEAPQGSILALFLAQIEQRMVADTTRTVNGGSLDVIPGGALVAVLGAGQRTDTERRLNV